MTEETKVQRLARLAYGLMKATEAGKVKWTSDPTFRSIGIDTYETKTSTGGVRISQVPDDKYRLVVLDSQGTEVDSHTVSARPTSAPPGRFQGLYESAKESVVGLTEIIDGILKDVGQGDLPTQ